MTQTHHRTSMRPSMGETRFQVDEQTVVLLEGLRATFGVATSAQVIRKALALANVVKRHADADNTITLAASNGNPAVRLWLGR
jgi:hypothetical protein